MYIDFIVHQITFFLKNFHALTWAIVAFEALDILNIKMRGLNYKDIPLVCIHLAQIFVGKEEVTFAKIRQIKVSIDGGDG